MAVIAEFHGGPYDGLIKEISDPGLRHQFPSLPRAPSLRLQENLEPCLGVYEYSRYKWNAETQVALYHYTGER